MGAPPIPPYGITYGQFVNNSWPTFALGYRFRCEIFLNAGSVNPAISNAQVSVVLNSANFASQFRLCQSTGADIIFADQTNTIQLGFERVTFDNSGSTNSEFIVDVSTLPAGTYATGIYMYYGNPIAVDQSASNLAFPGYRLVAHGADASTTSLMAGSGPFLGMTTLAKLGAAQPAVGVGVLGKAQDFGTNSYYATSTVDKFTLTNMPIQGSTWSTVMLPAFAANGSIPAQPAGNILYCVSRSSQANLAISAASNATPIRLTFTSNTIVTGTGVTITGVVGNTAANGTNYLKFISSTQADLYSDYACTVGVAGNGVYVSGGTGALNLTGCAEINPALGVSGAPIFKWNANDRLAATGLAALYSMATNGPETAYKLSNGNYLIADTDGGNYIYEINPTAKTAPVWVFNCGFNGPLATPLMIPMTAGAYDPNGTLTLCVCVTAYAHCDIYTRASLLAGGSPAPWKTFPLFAQTDGVDFRMINGVGKLLVSEWQYNNSTTNGANALYQVDFAAGTIDWTYNLPQHEKGTDTGPFQVKWVDNTHAVMATGTNRRTVTAATNASPINITLNSVPAWYVDGMPVTIFGVGTNTNANATYYIKNTVTGASGHFDLYLDAGLTSASTGNGTASLSSSSICVNATGSGNRLQTIRTTDQTITWSSRNLSGASSIVACGLTPDGTSVIANGAGLNSNLDAIQTADLAYGQSWPAITVASTVYPNGVPLTYAPIYSECPSSSSYLPGTQGGVMVAMNASNKVLFFAYDAAGTRHLLTSTSTLSSSAWHTVVATYDGSKMRVYIDGVLDATTVTASFSIGFPTSQPRLGSDYGSGDYWHGLLAEVWSIPGTAWSQNQVTWYNSVFNNLASVIGNPIDYRTG